MPKRKPFRLPPESNALAMVAINNLRSGQAVKNEDGSLSTIRSGSVNDRRLNGGAPTLIPFIWGGQLLDEQQAIEMALQSGLKFPMFMTHKQATKASRLISNQLPSTLEDLVNFNGLQLDF